MLRLLSLALPLALLLACGGGDPEPLTLDEYIADWCEPGDAGDELETWGEFAERGRAFIEEGRELLVHADLVGYHNGRIRSAQLLVTAAEGHEADAVLTPWGFLDVAVQVRALVDGAIASLPEDARQRLAAAECWGFDD